VSGPSVLIGTAGYSHAEWKGDFYPSGVKPPERLAYYAARFPAVEINMTFYRGVSEKTVRSWLAAVPREFRFSMKCSKVITHYKRLQGCRRDLRAQWEQWAPLGDQLCCAVFQLPPSLKPDPVLLEDFLAVARDTQGRAGAAECPLALEFRSRRWYEPETFRILDKYGATAVLHDMPYKGGFWPIQAEDGEMLLKSGHLLMLPEDWIADTSAHLFYFRFHGTVEKKPWREYGAEHLEPWARIAGRALNQGKPLFAFFNNDAHGYAPRDAALLRELLEHEGWETGVADAPRTVPSSAERVASL
jgi:uncharacterized protein YecE (DUF72 family)